MRTRVAILWAPGSRCARDGRVNVVLRFVPLSWRYTVIVCDTVSGIDIAGPAWDCDGGHPVVLGHDQPSAIAERFDSESKVLSAVISQRRRHG